MLTQERLKQVLYYAPETGKFTRLWRKGKVGTRDRHGYVQIGVDGQLYAAHRLAFLYATGAFPPHETDHINGVRDDNRWANLRQATKTQNMQNMKQLGPLPKGVAKNRRGFVSRIKVNRKSIYLGNFKTAEEAHAAYRAAAEKHFGGYAKSG